MRIKYLNLTLLLPSSVLRLLIDGTQWKPEGKETLLQVSLPGLRSGWRVDLEGQGEDNWCNILKKTKQNCGNVHN